MNVVFLDIAGVMTHDGHLVRSEKHRDLEWSPQSVSHLKEILNSRNAKIVVSSSLGIGETVNSINAKYFVHYGLDKNVVGITPFLGEYFGNRGNEIQEYMDAVWGTDLQVERFVIIDDDTDMLHLGHKLAHCNSIYGLTEDVKQKAIKIM